MNLKGLDYLNWAVAVADKSGDRGISLALKTVQLGHASANTGLAPSAEPSVFSPTHEFAVRAWQAREKLAGELESIQRNQELSDTAKTTRIEAATSEAQRDIASLAAQWQRTYDRAVTDARERLTTTPSDGADVLALRDAGVRAESLAKEEGALALLKSSLRLRDTMMAQVLLQRAVDSGWRGVADAYSQAFPDTAPQVETLWLDTHRTSAHLDALVDGHAFTPVDGARAAQAAGPAAAQLVAPPPNRMYAGVQPKRTLR